MPLRVSMFVFLLLYGQAMHDITTEQRMARREVTTRDKKEARV